MPINCPTCQKECASEFGLRVHSKKHEAPEPAMVDEVKENITLGRLEEAEKKLLTLESALKGVLPFVKELAREQAQKNFSGTSWMVNFNHRLQLYEKEHGIGPGPRTERPT